MPPAPAPIPPGVLEAAKLLVAKVDVGMDVEILQENDVVRFLYFSQKEMEGLAGGRPSNSARGHFGVLGNTFQLLVPIIPKE